MYSLLNEIEKDLDFKLLGLIFMKKIFMSMLKFVKYKITLINLKIFKRQDFKRIIRI